MVERGRGKRGLVISGGGSFGALGGGTLACLDRQYDFISGVSTGSLMAPLVGLRDWRRLREAYTSVSQVDIFDVNPFRQNGKINLVKVLARLATGKRTLGESNNLRKTIDRFLTDEDFAALLRAGIEVFVGVQETSHYPERVHHFSNLDYSPHDFRDWIWASANAPVVTTILKKEFTDADGIIRMGEWCDGGLTELLSLQKMIEKGARHIDVILHRYSRPPEAKGFAKDLFHNVIRLYNIMRKEIESNDMLAGLLSAELKKCEITVYAMPHKLADNSLMFDPQQMEKWWDLGYQTARDPARITRFNFSDPS